MKGFISQLFIYKYSKYFLHFQIKYQKNEKLTLWTVPDSNWNDRYAKPV